jgi:hypothetical protein
METKTVFSQSTKPYERAFYFRCNPELWPRMGDAIASCSRGEGKIGEDWSCANRDAKPGDRMFVSLIGSNGGIFAWGTIETTIKNGDEFKVIGKLQVCDPAVKIIPFAELTIMAANYHWHHQESGIEMNLDLAAKIDERISTL